MHNPICTVFAITLFAAQAYGVETQKPISTEVYAQATLIHSEKYEDYAMTITFEKASFKHKDIIFNWLEEPHVKEFWDNTPEHKDDILIFLGGRSISSTYNDGLYSYWIGSYEGEPYCMIMTLQEKKEYDIPEIKKAYLSKLGTTYSMDYMIGNTQFLGKGLGAKTLEAFIDYFREQIDPQADTFFIDPSANNPKARHVYEKAGFVYIADFIMGPEYSGAEQKHYFLVKKIAGT